MAFDFDASGNLITASAGGFDFDADGNLLSGEPKDDGGGFLSSAKQAIGATIKGAGQAAADYIPGVSQDNPVARYGRDVIEANPTAVSSFEDMADKPLTAVTEATGNAAGSMAGMLGARALGMGITAAAPLTGPAAPVTAAVGQIIAWLGPAAIAALPSYGGIRDKQILNDPAMEQDAKAKAVAALGAGTVGLIENKFGPQQWALSAMTKEGRAQLAKKFAETGLVKGIGYGAAKGGAIEGAEELVQNPVEQAAAFDNPLKPENLKETAFGGAMGAIGGGVLGGGTGAAVNIARPKATVSDVLAAPDVDSAIDAAQAAIAPIPESAPATQAVDNIARILQPAQGADAVIEPKAADITDVVPKETAAPATDAASLLERQSDPLAPMIEDRRIRTEAIDAAQQEAEQRKAAEIEAIPELAAEQNTVQAALDRAGSLDSPTAMQLALEKAKAPPAPAIEPAAAEPSPVEPRIVERTPGMVAMPRKLAEQRAAANPSLEIVRVQNQSGKFAYTVIPKAANVSADRQLAAVAARPDGRGMPDAGASVPVGIRADGASGIALEPRGMAEQSARQPVSLGRDGAAEPVATWFGRRGDGYLTEGDARMAIPSRQRVSPDLTWRVEQLPTGKFRLAGYAAPDVKLNDGTVRNLPSGSEATPIAGSRDATAGRGMEPAGPVVGTDGVRPVPASVNGPERRPGLQGLGQGDERPSAASAGQPRQDVGEVATDRLAGSGASEERANAPADGQPADRRAADSSAQVTQTPASAGVLTPAPTERERISAMAQAAKERKSAEASAKKERMASRKDVVGNSSERPAGDNTPGALADVMASWDAMGIKNWLSEKNGVIELSRIEVPFGGRSKGVGTRAMQQLIAYADATGQQIKLLASVDFGGDKTRLVPFYERFGFKRAPRSAPAESKRGTVMLREPVGANEGGRSADDTRKGAPTPDTSLARQGSPDAGMQERPAVRAVSGSLVEPAQSEGGAGSRVNPSTIAEAEQAAIQAGRAEMEAVNRRAIDAELISIQNNGNGADIDIDNPRLWDAENEELTPEGIAENDRLNLVLARERAGVRQIETLADLEGQDQTAQAEAFAAYADAVGLYLSKSYSSGGSRYVEVDINGKGYKFRFADHFNTVRDTTMQPDFNVAPGRNDFTEAFDYLLRKLNESPAPNSDGAQARSTEAEDGQSILNDPSPDEAEAVQSGIEGKTPIEAAEFIANNAPDESHRLIARRVAVRLKQLEGAGSSFNLHVAHVDSEAPATMVGAGIRGQVIQKDGDPETHIWIQGADVTGKVGTSYETVLHELVHAATQKAIDIGEHGAKGEIGVIVKELRAAMERVHNHLRDKLKSGTPFNEFERSFDAAQNNSLDNLHELTAWALTNKETQAYLESIPYKGASAWSSFVAAVRRFLGLSPGAETVLSEVMHVADKLLSIDVWYLLAESTHQGVHMRVNFAGARSIVNSSRSVMTGLALPKTWQGPDASKLDDVIYSMQDKHVDTKRVLQAVRDSVGAIADEQDPYLQEELFHGRAAMATKEFLEKSIRPLLTDMQARGVDMSDFEEYLHNRHAERRNVQVAKVNPNMQDGGSGIKTADARAYLAGLPANKRQAYQALARRVDQINKDTRALLVSSGLEKQSTIDAWDAAYGDEYVPLMREEMDNGMGIGQGYSVRGSTSKRAMGSNKPVANIMANIALQREKAITRANKRRIGEALYGLVLKAPNDEFWFAVDPELQKSPAQVTATALQLISIGLNPADAQSIAQEPTQSYIDPQTGLVAQRINPALRSADNVLAVRIDGEDKYVFFNAQDERAMRMATALKNLDADQLGTVMGNVAKMTRWFAAVNTQYNPIFGVTNITRDVQTALLNLNSTPLKDHKTEVMKHILPALRGIYIDLRDHRAGKQPTSSYAAIFEEFQREGGATGYRDMYANAQERADAIADELAKINQGKAMALGRGIMGWLSDYNESMENAVRVAAYKVGKEQGMSNQQAASLAKNLTVNFNRKGQVALQAGALYAFFNASVQGSARLAQTMFEGGKLSAVGKKILRGGLLLGAMQALVLAWAGFDDDDPPDFVRERSLIIPIGGKKYISIPMPLGFHVIPNLGRIPTEWAMGGFKNTPKRIGQLIGLFADAFNPIGSAGLSLQTLTPTIIDPLAALSENRDWTGKPIAKKDFDSMHPTAGHTRAKDTATPWAKLISWTVNAATGGTDYKPGLASPTPDQIDYLIGQVTGGVGREVGKLSQVVGGTLSGEEVPLHKIPLVGRFVGTTEGQAAEASRFYDNLREIGEHKAEIDGLRKDGKGAQIAAYVRENKQATLVPMAEAVYRDVSKLQKIKRDLIKKDAPRERVKLVEMQITARMKILNDRVRAAEKKN